jgi:hypothetical protein
MEWIQTADLTIFFSRMGNYLIYVHLKKQKKNIFF